MSHHYSGISHLQQIISDRLNTSSEFLSPTDTPETNHGTGSLFHPTLSGIEVKILTCVKLAGLKKTTISW